MNFAYVALRELEYDKGLVDQLLYFFGNAKDHGFIFQRAREMKKETDMSTYVEIGKRRKKQWPKLKAREGDLFYLASDTMRENKMRCFSCGICQTNESKSILKVSLSQVYACSH